MFLLKVVESSKPDAWAHNETYCPCLHGSGMQCKNFPISFSIKKNRSYQGRAGKRVLQYKERKNKEPNKQTQKKSPEEPVNLTQE